MAMWIYFDLSNMNIKRIGPNKWAYLYYLTSNSIILLNILPLKSKPSMIIL